MVIFDELHKKKQWKLWLKGLYDSGRFKKQHALVTGSARLSHVKKVGDSFAGRFFEYRLYPFDLKELKGNGHSTLTNYKRLLERGGFPEPLLELDLDGSRKWRKTVSDVILRQDLYSIEFVKDIDALELLIEMLSTRVGSTVSYNSLAEDLKISDLTVKRYLKILENLYIVFRVSASSGNLIRGLSKSGKYYFYDLGRVQGDEAAKLENLVALSFKKELDFLEDSKGLRTKLSFLRNKEKQEVDYFVAVEGQKPRLVEVKVSEDQVSKSLWVLGSQLKNCEKIQLVGHLKERFDSRTGVRVENALEYLENLHFM